MSHRYARRSQKVSESIFTELIHYLEDPEFISFSGGFPSPNSFPIEALEKASTKVFKEDGANALQYSSTQGYYPLRKWIADRYLSRQNLVVNPEDILITTGSQQALDLISKTFLDPFDHVVVENPSYLGALQSLSMFEPIFHKVELLEDGLDLEELKIVLDTYHPKLLYVVPNFQNPTGISYSQAKREALVQLIQDYDVIVIEDDPYGELRYVGKDKSLLKSLCPQQVLLMGSFSKIISPGMRIGWVVSPQEINTRLFVAKEASDLHASTLDQRIIYQYLIDNNLDDKLSHTKAYYAHQRHLMLEAMKKYFPKEIKVAPSEGGMFFWVTLPKEVLAKTVFKKAIEHKVIFIPGDPFYVDAHNIHTLRLNYTSPKTEELEEGIKRLAAVFKEVL